MARQTPITFRPTKDTQVALRFGPPLAHENQSQFIRRAVEERAERLVEELRTQQVVEANGRDSASSSES